MRSTEEIRNLIKQFNGDRQKTFAEFIAELFKDKYIEIYLGDSYEEVSVEQISTSYPAVFCGKVLGAYRECLVIDSFYITGPSKQKSHGNIVFISERSIRSLCEVDGYGSINDLFIKSGSESVAVKSFIKEDKEGK
jgi:hypothetical protein